MGDKKQNSWRELKEELCQPICTGALAAGEALPSIRSLVASKGAHHSTVRKAYDEMLSDGLIEKRKGLSPIVAKDAAAKLQQAKRREFLEIELPRFRKLMESLDLTWSDLENLSPCP